MLKLELQVSTSTDNSCSNEEECKDDSDNSGVGSKSQPDVYTRLAGQYTESIKHKRQLIEQVLYLHLEYLYIILLDVLIILFILGTRKSTSKK